MRKEELLPTGTTHPLIERYLKRSNEELAHLDAARRAALVASIRGDIEAALADVAGTDADVRAALKSLGSPADVAAAAHRRAGIAPPRGGPREVVAIALLLVGAVIVPAIGWSIGVVLLWTSRVWTRRDKIIGTAVVPGGLGLPIVLAVVAVTASDDACISEPGPGGTLVEVCDPTTGATAIGSAILVLLTLAPILTAFHLARRMRRSRAGG